MIVTKTHQKHSLVEKELAKIVDSQEEKSINSFAGKELTLEPTNDLLFDISKLAEALRRQGKVAQADLLEKKAVLHKLADNVHLYRAIDEDGEDLINFAHPDKAVEAVDGGEFNTILTRHDQVMDNIKKQPTGKVAAILEDVEGLLGLKKKADVSPAERIETNKKALLLTLNNNKLSPKFVLGGNNLHIHFDSTFVRDKDAIKIDLGSPWAHGADLPAKVIQGPAYGLFESLVQNGGGSVN
jgi:hypothetical protein